MSAKELNDFEVSISEHWNVLKDSSVSFRKTKFFEENSL